jgi:hypothetical protein
MANAQYNTGSRNQPLGDRKAGISNDLDALAAYVASLNIFPASPHRNSDGSLTAAAVLGREIFISRNCASCHSGTAFSGSGNNNPRDIGTIKPASGKRLGGTLAGIDIPTLRDVWATAPYLHDGSASTLADAIRAHDGIALSDSELLDLVAYVQQIGNQETSAPAPAPTGPNTGTGLSGSYYNNATLSGSPVLQRVEAVDFNWSSGAPAPSLPSSQFSVRWSGKVEAVNSGNYQFQTASNDGVRLWINGVLVIDAWTNTTTTRISNSANIAMTANTQHTITMEYYENTGSAVARLRWKRPGLTSYTIVPASRLYQN